MATLVDKRIPAEGTKTEESDIISKCGAEDPELECLFYKKSKYRKTCLYDRFGIMCDRLAITNTKEEDK